MNKNINLTQVPQWAIDELDAEAKRLSVMRGWKVDRLQLIRAAVISRAERAKRQRLQAKVAA